MHELNDDQFGCGHCHMQSSCPMKTEDSAQDGSQAHFDGLASAAMTVFLLPLGMGIVGAYVAARLWAKDTSTSLGHWHVIGLVAGLTVGVILAKLLVWLRRPTKSLPGRR